MRTSSFPDEILAFVKTYVPILEAIDADPVKKNWCRNYQGHSTFLVAEPNHNFNVIQQTPPNDDLNLYKIVYDRLMSDAYECELVNKYGPKYRELLTDHSITEKKADLEQLQKLSDEQLLAIIAMQIRADYWCNGDLICQYVGDGLLLHYMRELFWRWFPEGIQIF